MNELVNTIATTVGISEAQAQQAVDLMLGYAGKRLPPHLALQLEGALRGDQMSGVSDRANERINEYRDTFGSNS